MTAVVYDCNDSDLVSFKNGLSCKLDLTCICFDYRSRLYVILSWIEANQKYAFETLVEFCSSIEEVHFTLNCNFLSYLWLRC